VETEQKTDRSDEGRQADGKKGRPQNKISEDRADRHEQTTNRQAKTEQQANLRRTARTGGKTSRSGSVWHGRTGRHKRRRVLSKRLGRLGRRAAKTERQNRQKNRQTEPQNLNEADMEEDRQANSVSGQTEGRPSNSEGQGEGQTGRRSRRQKDSSRQTGKWTMSGRWTRTWSLRTAMKKGRHVENDRTDGSSSR